nr:MAG TPA: hypothetical protein [Caudoviricetes sp.]
MLTSSKSYVIYKTCSTDMKGNQNEKIHWKHT